LKPQPRPRRTAEAPYPKVVAGISGLDRPVERRSGKDRRTLSVWSVLYGGFRPRRRRGRRHEDHEHSWLDWHEPSVLYMSVAIVLLSCIDALFTLNLLAVGGEEINVLMDRMIGRGVDQFLLVKIGLTCMSVVLLGVAARWRFFGLFRVSRILEVTCAGYALLICYEIFLLLRFLEDSGADWSPLGALTLG
jgi:hypothetical protein